MNSQFPNSPEDKLLDELLREQSHGPDEAFLKQLEAAVDAGSVKSVKRPAPRRYGRLAIAAGIGLAAGTGFFVNLQNRESKMALAVNTERGPALGPVLERPSVSSGDLREAIREQETKAEESRKELAASVRTKGIIPSDPSFSNQTDAPVALADQPPAPVSPVESDLTALAARDKDSVTTPSPSAAPAKEALLKSDSREKFGRGAGDGLGNGLGAGGGGGKMFGLIRESTGAEFSGGMPSSRTGDFYDAAPDSVSSDRYGTFIDQPWKSPGSDPLSTFSIDVDTASYSNVRRMIREGREVPKDAVRIEECINAFSYNYAQPKGEGPFAVGATLAACPWNPSHQLVRVAIKGREIEANKRPASNLVFLVDVSGSMQSPDKLPLLKQSMATMVEQLDERDRVAIVVYAGTEGVALPSTRLDAAGKATVLKSLGKLEAGGSTNGGAGIKRAYELAMKEKIEGGVNRVILATDGDFNVGVTGQSSLVELVKERAKSGVYLTVVGFGTGNLNDAMMDAITHDGNGNYFYIDSEREGRKVFLQNLSGTLVTIAKDVKIQVKFNPSKVGSYRLIGYANRVLKNEDFNNDKVDAGDIGAGHSVTAFYELASPGEGAGTDALKYQAAPEKPAASAEWLTVKLRYKHPDGNESSKIEFPLTGEVQALDQTEPDFQFATAAALFGMKLRSMEEVRDFGWDKVIALATPGLANDASEDRAEFVGLLKKLAGTMKILPEPAEVLGGKEHQVVPMPKSVSPLELDSDFNLVDGPHIKVIQLKNGARSVWIQSSDKTSLTKKLFTADGILESTTVFGVDGSGNLLSAKIFSAAKVELFHVVFRYDKSSGKMIAALVFDSQTKSARMEVLQVGFDYAYNGSRIAGEPRIDKPEGAEAEAYKVAYKSKIEPLILGEAESIYDQLTVSAEEMQKSIPRERVVPAPSIR